MAGIETPTNQTLTGIQKPVRVFYVIMMDNFPPSLRRHNGTGRD